MKTKKCITCGKRKKVSEFAVRSDNGKVRGSCKKCLVEKAKISRNKNKKKYQKIDTGRGGLDISWPVCYVVGLIIKAILWQKNYGEYSG